MADLFHHPLDLAVPADHRLLPALVVVVPLPVPVVLGDPAVPVAHALVVTPVLAALVIPLAPPPPVLAPPRHQARDALRPAVAALVAAPEVRSERRRVAVAAMLRSSSQPR